MADIPTEVQAMNGQVSLSTRLKVWWDTIPLVTRSVFVVCTAIYAVGLLTGWDDLGAVCLAPDLLFSGQLYRLLTSAIFHAGVLHLTFNMMAFLPIGSSLERALGSVQLLCLILKLIFLGDAAYVAMAYAAAVAHLPAFMAQCAVGFSGVVFGLIVVDNDANGAALRSIFGLFTVPARAYPWALLMAWTLLVPQASFLGHLSGLLVGQLYVWGWLRWAVPSAPAIHAVERSTLAVRWLTPSPAFIVHAAGSGGCGISDVLLPVSQPAGGGDGSARTGQGWWHGPWMPYPSGYGPLPPSPPRETGCAKLGSGGSCGKATVGAPGGAREGSAAAAASSSGGGGSKAAAAVGGSPAQLNPKAAAAAAAEARVACSAPPQRGASSTPPKPL